MQISCSFLFHLHWNGDRRCPRSLVYYMQRISQQVIFILIVLKPHNEAAKACTNCVLRMRHGGSSSSLAASKLMRNKKNFPFFSLRFFFCARKKYMIYLYWKFITFLHCNKIFYVFFSACMCAAHFGLKMEKKRKQQCQFLIEHGSCFASSYTSLYGYVNMYGVVVLARGLISQARLMILCLL